MLAAAAVSPLKVMVAGGHPGDPEYGCGGTVARFTELGHRVTLLYLNRGEKGCGGTSTESCASRRSAEAERACALLRARPFFLSQRDGEPIVNAAEYDRFRKVIATERPDIVFTHWPIDNHRDHRAISMLTYDAWVHMKRNFGLCYYEVSDGEDTSMFSPTAYVDITGVEPRKRAACFAHASQTPARYYDLQTQVAVFRGLESGHRLAEAFLIHPQSPKVPLPQ